MWSAGADPVRTLVLGVGNRLRGDDGAGPELARRVAALGLDGVEAREVHQLAPELAEEIASRPGIERVILADASPSVAAPVIGAVAAAAPRCGLSHRVSPEVIAHLAGALFGSGARFYLCELPASEFGHGEPLSPAARAGVAGALDRIRDLLGAGGRDRSGG